MIIRIVKMIFRTDEVLSFQQLFEERKHLIRGFEGCTHLELWQDKNDASIFFTYSHWDTEAHLEAYRASRFFEETWKLTKSKFKTKPEAWTVKTLHQL
ncbi:MAG TPA: antibiotic biosynthesis monooxygenase family protein [Flavisolibacter sp.]|nr:antibiotic biosynthesis monooxygenase family protein [Flavisolibacter sp.]